MGEKEKEKGDTGEKTKKNGTGAQPFFVRAQMALRLGS
jgi:hypothetical protein